MRATLAILAALFALAACAPPPPTIGPDGKPLPKIYRLSPRDAAKVQYRMLDAVNALRVVAGAPELVLSAELTAAAATHSRDMSVQNRPWHFGSDGSSPLDRVRLVGYQGRMLGEAISETFETELETLGAWMESPGSRAVLLDPEAREMGFAYYQEPTGKIWWTLVTGTPTLAGDPAEPGPAAPQG